MARVIYRRLLRVFYRSATFSTSKWTRPGPGDDLGWNYLSKTSRTLSKNYISGTGGVSTPPFLTRFVVELKETDDNETQFDPDHPANISENISSAGSQDSLNVCNPKTKLRIMSKPPKKRRNLDDVETFSSKDDPRAFQKLRPEYKSVCYSAKRLRETSIEEGEDLLQKVSRNLKPVEMSEFLEELSYLPENYLSVLKANPKFKALCRYVASSLHLYKDSELIGVLGAFARISPEDFPKLKYYEQEFCHRVGRLSTNEMLLVADTFRFMSCGVPRFLSAMYSCMQERCSDLSLVQLVELAYIVGEGRHVPQELLEKLEKLVARHLTSMNLEEIGAVCLGFFKTSNGLSEPLMRQLGDIVVNDVERLSNYSLVNILKMFRFTRVDHTPFFMQIGKEAHKRIPEMGSQGIMHVVLAFAAMHFLNEDLMNAVALAMPERVAFCRSKDLAKFLWSFGVLNYKPPNADVFYSAFINQIRQNLEEFKSFPEHFLTCLMGLAFCKQYPFDLIDIALSEDFIMRSTKISLFELKKDLFTIAGTVEIECPEYTGNKISQEFRQDVTDLLVELSSRDIHVKAEVIDATIMLQYALGGPQFVKEHMILPHTRSKDLEVHLDVNKKPITVVSNTKTSQPLQKRDNVKITDDLLSQLTNASKSTFPNGSKETCGLNNLTRPISETKPDVVKLAIQVTNRNQYLYGSRELLGLHSLKRRQLRKLGYVVVEVPYWEWFPLAKRSKQEKLAYLRQKVFSAV